MILTFLAIKPSARMRKVGSTARAQITMLLFIVFYVRAAASNPSGSAPERQRLPSTTVAIKQ